MNTNLFVLAICASTLKIAASAAPTWRMPSWFGDDMILQTNHAYGSRAFLSGEAEAGEVVTVAVKLGGNGHNKGTTETYTTAGDATTGAWTLMLNPKNIGTAATITVSGANDAAAHVATATGVLWGDVFFCSGQSNMVFPMSLTLNAKEEIATVVNYPNFRLFQVAQAAAPPPMGEQFDVSAKWVSANETTLPNFSAVCYMTARDIVKMLAALGRGVPGAAGGGGGTGKNTHPVGLIQSAWGGTRVEAWMSPAALAKCDPKPFPDPLAGKDQNDPTALWNSMVAPFSNGHLSFRAVLWYQGEANASGGNSTAYYGCMFNAMIASWRERFGNGDFAFMWQQLPPSVTAQATGPGADQGRPAIRAAQALALPRPGGPTDISGMSVGIDLGGVSKWGVDHPIDKGSMSHRLALATLHAAWGLQWDQGVRWTGPLVTGATANAANRTVEVAFEPWSAGGLHLAGAANCDTCCNMTKPPAHHPFQLLGAGAGAAWSDATVVDLDGTAGVVRLQWGKGLTAAPVAVRFAPTNFVECVLYNSDKLPSAPWTINVTAGVAAAPMAANALDGAAPPMSGPPMGFNSWNGYHTNIDENIVKSIATAFHTLGLAKAGYEFINLDDGWQVDRAGSNENGTIIEDPVRFPSGMKALASAVHAQGLKFGVYTARGSRTCQGRPGAFEHELIDANSYCDWGLDYLKNDNCGGSNWPKLNTSWILFKEGFDQCYKKTGRYTVRSIEYCRPEDSQGCQGWIADVANLWRTTGDVQATWASVMSNIHNNDKMASVVNKASVTMAFNDPDMLQVGNVGLSVIEQESHFALWCLAAAPLLLGTDIMTLDATALALVTNNDLIATNQDPGLDGAQQGVLTTTAANGDCEVWVKHLASPANSAAVILLNVGDSTLSSSCRVKWGVVWAGYTGMATVRDMLHQVPVPGKVDGFIAAELPAHGVAAIRVTQV